MLPLLLQLYLLLFPSHASSFALSVNPNGSAVSDVKDCNFDTELSLSISQLNNSVRINGDDAQDSVINNSDAHVLIIIMMPRKINCC